MKRVKKIKKIPKYNNGTGYVPNLPQWESPQGLTTPTALSGGSNFGINNIAGVVGSVASPIASTFGIEQGKAGLIIGSVGKEVSKINPIVGAGVQLLGATAGARAKFDPSKVSTTSDIADAVSHNSGWIGGLFGADRDELLRDANSYQNSMVGVELTANKRAEWANDPRNQYAVQTVKDGGVIIGNPAKGLTRAQVDSREVITDKNGNNAVRLPYAKGTDSIPVLIQPTYKVFSDDKGFADIAEKIIKGTKEGSRLREIEMNKLAMILEMTKVNKPSKSSVLHAKDGDIVPYSYNKDMSQFAYWDDDKKGYKKEYLDWVNALTETDVKDIYSGKYGDMSTYLRKNKGRVPTVEQARKLMTDLKYGDWHKIAQTVYDKKNSGPEVPKETFSALDMIKAAAAPGSLSVDSARNLKINTPGIRLHKPKSKLNIDSNLSTIADYAPLLAAYLNDPEFHVETPETWIPKFAPVGVSIEAQRRAIDDSMAMARYNLANISPNTGAGMAYGLQAASNRAKQLADVYTYQTNAQNELIGRNIDRYNQWAPSMAAARLQAIADTRANEAAADAQRDVRIKDAMSYLRDRQMLPFLKQYLSSGAYDKSIKKLS